MHGKGYLGNKLRSGLRGLNQPRHFQKIWGLEGGGFGSLDAHVWLSDLMTCRLKFHAFCRKDTCEKNWPIFATVYSRRWPTSYFRFGLWLRRLFSALCLEQLVKKEFCSLKHVATTKQNSSWSFSVFFLIWYFLLVRDEQHFNKGPDCNFLCLVWSVNKLTNPDSEKTHYYSRSCSWPGTTKPA